MVNSVNAPPAARPAGETPHMQSERAPLVSKATNKNRMSNVLRQIDFLIVFLGPFFTFLFTGLLWTYEFLYRPKFCVLWIFFGCMGFVTLYLLRKEKWIKPLCFLGVPALLLGAFVGLYLYDEHAIFPEFYKNSRKYTNVVPAQPAAAVADAGKIVFSGETFVDTSQSVGLIEENGVKYCVAPIRDGSGIQRIEFWAAGVGCCGARGDFYCDAANNAEAKAGIVIFDNNGIFESARFDLYDKARKKAQAEYSLQSVTYPIYVRWVKESDLDMLSNNYRNQALLLGLFIYALYFGVSLFIAFTLYDPQLKTGPGIMGRSAVRGPARP